MVDKAREVVTWRKRVRDIHELNEAQDASLHPSSVLASAAVVARNGARREEDEKDKENRANNMAMEMKMTPF